MKDRIRAVLAPTLAALALAGCATSSTVDPRSADPAAATAGTVVRTPSQVTVTDKDVTDRKYISLGDISVTVKKSTIFHADPTPELVNQKLREKAAELGADMVILVRYSKGKTGFMNRGSLEGKGRAIRLLQ